MSNKKFSTGDRIKSFGYAFEGLSTFFRTQHNSWIHVAAAVVAVAAGFYCRINSTEWCWIIAAIALVFITELFNTAIEFLCDVVSPGIHPQIKKVKDIAASAVLIAAIAAVIIAVVIFAPFFSPLRPLRPLRALSYIKKAHKCLCALIL